MVIGIPRAFLYHKYNMLWKTFFDQLGVEYIVSPETNKQIVDAGSSLAIDEACLSSKIYLGHVNWLIDKCDYILVPRISGYGREGSVCTKFQAIYDVVYNTFRDQKIRLINYNIDPGNSEGEIRAFIKLGKQLKRKKTRIMLAYMIAKQAEKTSQQLLEHEQQKTLAKAGFKVLVVAHRYNICDKWIGEPIINMIKQQGAITVIADYADRRNALEKSSEISATLPWAFNKELVGAVAIYQEQVDGIILMSTFPCGPDSLVNEILSRRIKNKPVLNLILDGQEGQAGLETRIESFIDIIKFRQEDIKDGIFLKRTDDNE